MADALSDYKKWRRNVKDLPEQLLLKKQSLGDELKAARIRVTELEAKVAECDDAVAALAQAAKVVESDELEEEGPIL